MNFEGTPVEIAKQQKSKFKLYKFMNLEDIDVAIAKQQKNEFD